MPKVIQGISSVLLDAVGMELRKDVARGTISNVVNPTVLLKFKQGVGVSTLIYKNKTIFIGCVKKTESGELWRNGKGIIIFPSGNHYEGSFENNSLPFNKKGRRDGTGTWTIRDKKEIVFKGTVKDGKRHGLGKIELPDGVGSKFRSIEGNFVNDRLQLSSVTLEYKKRASEKTGRVYQGEFTGGRSPNGKGKMTAHDGSSYDGEWKDGKPHGQGTLICPKPFKSYVGNFENGKKHGFGKATYCNGIIHIGQWENDKQHGYVFTYKGRTRDCHRWEKGRKKKKISEEDIPKSVRDFIDKS